MSDTDEDYNDNDMMLIIISLNFKHDTFMHTSDNSYVVYIDIDTYLRFVLTGDVSPLLLLLLLLPISMLLTQGLNV